jgi:hypothetical protein
MLCPLTTVRFVRQNMSLRASLTAKVLDEDDAIAAQTKKQHSRKIKNAHYSVIF